jgi:DNA-directed RNA polymerase specialized sigma24 family protein
MADKTAASNQSLIPPQPIPAEVRDFARQITGLLDGKPKDEAAIKEAFEGLDNAFDLIAAGLYSLASMLVGEGEDSMGLVETAVAEAEVSACHDATRARKSGRRALAISAIQLIQRRQPGCLAAPAEPAASTGCIGDDDLDAAGVSGQQIETMIAGPDRERVRAWLNSLPVDSRVIFALRAVAGFTSSETAEMLAEHGGPRAVGWTADAVRDTFRQGLCSLASQLLHATSGR